MENNQEFGLKNGTYRLVITEVDNKDKVAYGIFRDHNGEEITKIIIFGHLEQKLGKDYFKVGKNFNITVGKNGRIHSHTPVPLNIKKKN